MMPKKNTVESQVADALGKVTRRQEALAVTLARSPRWRTTCALALPIKTEVVIPVERRVEALVFVQWFLEVLGERLEAGGLKPEFSGYPIADWSADIDQRIAQLAAREESEKLEAMERALSPLLTESQMREKQFAELADQLGALGLS
jgi:hypothetical protein